MNPETPFEAWLTRATYKLARDGAECVRAEIGEHYQHTLASGATPEQAICALGDPKQANRDYRRVFLTESEANWATTITKSTPSLRRIGIVLSLMAAQTYFFPSSSLWIMWVLVSFDVLPYFFYPANTAERSRKHLVWGLLRSAPALLFVHVMGGSFANCVILLATTIYLKYQRWTIFRKLAGKPAPKYFPRWLPGPLSLTRHEAVLLDEMKQGRELTLRRAMLPVLAILAAGAYFLPLVFGAPAALLALRFVLPSVLEVNTRTRSRWFVRANTTLQGLTVILPLLTVILPLFGIFVPRPVWFPAKDFGMYLGYAWFGTLVFVFALLILTKEGVRQSLRRKLPIEDWPQELYL